MGCVKKLTNFVDDGQEAQNIDEEHNYNEREALIEKFESMPFRVENTS